MFVPAFPIPPEMILWGAECLIAPPFFFVVFAIMSDAPKAAILQRPLAWQEAIKEGLQVGLLIDAFLLIAVAFIFSAGPITHWVAATSAGNHALLTTCAVASGLALFLLRRHQRTLYGIIEVAAAVAGMVVYPVAPIQASQALTISSTAWFLGLLSLVYILVRGLDNIDIGRTSTRRGQIDGERAQTPSVNLHS